MVVLKKSEAEIYRVLFGLSQVLAGHSDLETLCNALADSLRAVIPFDFLSLVLHDPVRDELRIHALNARRPTGARPPVVVRVDSDHPGACVWRNQQPLVLSPLSACGREKPYFQEAAKAGIEAFALLPLSTGSRRLGILGLGFTSHFDPDDGSLPFLGRVASEVAVTVDGFLTRQELIRERDRMRVLFEITNSMISKLPIDELFSVVSDQLHRVVAHNLACISLLNSGTGEITLSALHSPDGFHLEPEGDAPATIHPDGLPAGEAILSAKPVVVNEPDFGRFPSALYRRLVEAGFKFDCCIPLLGRQGILGVLDVARSSNDPFTGDEVYLLEQVGRQIAIAMENSLAYRELSSLRDKLATEKFYLEDEIRFDQNIGDMIGESPAFQAVLGSIQVVARTGATVLIEGETGTGKELVARALHDLSDRSERSFIKVNCAAIPASLLESELFGHEKGSFTGAFAQKIGRFELAHQGTLFLDEIGEISLELQSKLLRAIQEQEFERLGGIRTIRVDVRLVAATNRNLKQMVEEGKFRSDLYYRLHVFPLSVPPLRERREDIPLLVRYFTQKFAKRMDRPIDSIPASVLEALASYDWPGNIRELQNVIERSVILSPGRVLQVALPELAQTAAFAVRSSRGEEDLDRNRILKALRESGGKVSGPEGAAARLGLRRTTLQSRMKKLGIERHFN